jgi:hypothetical protein
MAVSKIITLVGESKDSWVDATTKLIKEAQSNLRGITRIRVAEFDVKCDPETNEITAFRVKAEVAFRVEQ